MIIGFGLDIVDARRIKQVLERFGGRFLERIYSEGERAYCMARREPELHLAARFGAKEAFIKAVGTGRGIKWKDIEVASKPGGAPYLALRGGAKEIAREMNINKMHLTLAHDAGIGVAAVILEVLENDE